MTTRLPRYDRGNRAQTLARHGTGGDGMADEQRSAEGGQDQAEGRPRWLAGPTRLTGAILAGAVAGAAALAWALWPAPAAAPAPQARHYLNVSACLLTGPAGVTPGSPAAGVWSAMESASLASRVMVSYLPDTGPADVTSMLNTLIQRQCGVIVTAGMPARKVLTAARAHPRQRFVLVTAAGSVAIPAPGNTVVASPATAPARIGRAIRRLAAQA
jgi:hypothetical protein